MLKHLSYFVSSCQVLASGNILHRISYTNGRGDRAFYGHRHVGSAILEMYRPKGRFSTAD